MGADKVKDKIPNIRSIKTGDIFSNMLSWPLEITIIHIKYNSWNIAGIHKTQNALGLVYNERKKQGP